MIIDFLVSDDIARLLSHFFIFLLCLQNICITAVYRRTYSVVFLLILLMKNILYNAKKKSSLSSAFLPA